MALTMFAVRAPWELEPLGWATADTVASVLDLDMNRYWKPTARSYFGRVSKENILAAVSGSVGSEAAERIAEIGSAFLCANLGIALEPRADHAAYLSSWLTVLKSDKRAIFTAEALAQKEADWQVAKSHPD